MRVLSIPHAYSPVRGGAERYVQAACELLAGRGHEVRVVVARTSSPEAFYSFGVPALERPTSERLNGVEVHRVEFGGLRYRLVGALLDLFRASAPTRERWLQGFRDRLTKVVESEILRYQPDVVLTLPHLFSNVRSVLEVRKRIEFRLVIVPLLHEHDPNWPFEEMRQAVARADGVIALTRFERNRLIDGYGARPDRVSVCPLGIDVPPDPRVEHERSETVIFMGRKSLSKGIEQLVAAMRLVWLERPEARLILAGATSPGTDVTCLLADLTSAERERIDDLDDVSDRDRDQLLSNARCLVVPSVNESFGLVVLEAWAAGTPVVAPNTPVFRETVEPGGDGLLVDVTDPAAIATAIGALLGDPGAAAAMGRRGRAKVIELYERAQFGSQIERALVAAARSNPDGDDCAGVRSGPGGVGPA